MRFWDSSALVPVVVAEKTSSWARQLFRAERRGVTWALSMVEVRSALVRRVREQSLSRKEYSLAIGRSERLFTWLTHVVELDLVRERACRLLDLHSLRAADALQLAAALVAARERPRTVNFVTLDARLVEAAEREGFEVKTAL